MYQAPAPRVGTPGWVRVHNTMFLVFCNLPLQVWGKAASASMNSALISLLLQRPRSLGTAPQETHFHDTMSSATVEGR